MTFDWKKLLGKAITRYCSTIPTAPHPMNSSRWCTCLPRFRFSISTLIFDIKFVLKKFLHFSLFWEIEMKFKWRVPEVNGLTEWHRMSNAQRFLDERRHAELAVLGVVLPLPTASVSGEDAPEPRRKINGIGRSIGARFVGRRTASAHSGAKSHRRPNPERRESSTFQRHFPLKKNLGEISLIEWPFNLLHKVTDLALDLSFKFLNHPHHWHT